MLITSTVMKICLDVQSAVTQRAGVGRYTKLLVDHLGPMAGSDDLELFFFDFKRAGMPFPVNGATSRPVRWFPGRLAQAAWKRIHWPPFNWFAGQADIYHFPNFTTPPLTRGKAVVTIHDMSFMRYPEFAEERNRRYLAACLTDTVTRSDRIITVSQFSADEVSGLLGVPMDRIVPIHHGISQEFQDNRRPEIPPMLKALGIDRPYLLTVGTVEPRKNIPFLVDVFEALEDFDGLLVVAGMPGWKYDPILARMKDSPCADRIRYIRFVDDAVLPTLYTQAELFVCASFYEGFGFPPLEAMACGTPVLSSTGGSLQEVLSPAASLMSDFNREAWVAAAQELLTDSVKRKDRIAQGKEHAAKFTWEQTAKKTWDVYRSLAS